MFHVWLRRKDEQQFVGTIYHKVSRRLETAVQMEWSAGSNDTKFAIAAKYCPDIDTTFRVLATNSRTEISAYYTCRYNYRCCHYICKVCTVLCDKTIMNRSDVLCFDRQS